MKKNKQKLYKSNYNSSDNYSTIIKITVGVIITLVLVYIVTAIGTGEIKLKKHKKNQTETTIQYQEIMAGETFNRSSKEYYVLFYNFTDKLSTEYLSLISDYKNSDNSIPVYTVDLEKKFNEEYATNTLEVTNPTMFKIKNGEKIDVINGSDNIIELLGE